MPTKPTCLHIPALYEEGTARITWEQVEDVEGYELDCHFDQDFQSALTGKTWGNIQQSTIDWSAMDQQELTWSDFESLPATGISWSYFDFLALGWEAMENHEMTWQQFGKLPPKFTVFKGDGEKTPAPDQGLTWANIDSSSHTWSDTQQPDWSWEDFELQPSIGQSWGQMDSKAISWEEMDNAPCTWQEIEQLPPYGLCWSSLDGRWLQWGELESEDLTWEGLETLPADAKTHIAHTLDIPIYKKKAIFRVRSYNQENYSQYLTTALLITLPRSLAKYKPPCIHLPEKFYEGDTADIHWGDLYGAQGFLLERKCTGDAGFQNINGGKWSYVLAPGNKENCPILSKVTDVATHIHFVDTLPYNQADVTYRVKAYNTTDSSQYNTSEKASIIPVFYRSGEVALNVVAGMSYLVPLYAADLERIAQVVVNLAYNPSFLTFQGLSFPETTGLQVDNMPRMFGTNVISHENGVVRFGITGTPPSGKSWSGCFAVARFIAAKSGTATVQLS